MPRRTSSSESSLRMASIARPTRYGMRTVMTIASAASTADHTTPER
jgi:hypothetical protein